MMTFEEAKDLKNSSIWEKVNIEINDRIDKCLQQMRVCSVDDFLVLQLKIKMYEELRNLPQDVIDRNDIRV